MMGYWFNFNRGYISEEGTVKLNCRYVGIPPKISKINYIFGDKYSMWYVTDKTVYLFGNKYSMWYDANKTDYLFGRNYSIFYPVNNDKYMFGGNYSLSPFNDGHIYTSCMFGKGYSTDWRGDNG